MKQITVKKLLILVWLTMIGTTALAQIKVQVLRKNYEKTVTANNIRSLSISAENADIELVGWDNESISYEVIVATKHPEKQQVLDDYKKMKFLEETLNRTLYLRSYLLINQNEEKPKANFDVTYRIKVPKKLAVTLKNSFGSVSVTGLSNRLDGTFKFCKINIDNNEATVDFSTSYGDLSIKNLFNDLALTAKHTTLSCEKITGNVKLNTNYGKLNLRPDGDFNYINIQSDKTEIVVESGSSPRYAIALKSENTQLELPKFLQKKRSDANADYFEYNAGNSTKLSINATFGSLTFK